MPLVPPKKESETVFGPLVERARLKIDAIEQRDVLAERMGALQRKEYRGHIPPWDLPPEELWIDGEEPPGFTEFVTSKQYMGGFLYPRQRAAIVNSIGDGAREVFYPRPTIEEYKAHRLTDVNNSDDITSIIMLLYGKGSGKDYLIAYVTAWIAYVVCSMQDPWAYFTHAYGESFDIVNMAVNAAQAEGVFFTKLRNNIRRQCFLKFDPDVSRAQVIFYRKWPGFLDPVKMLRLHSLHSASEGYEGFNLLSWTMDEAAGMELSSSSLRRTKLSEDGEEFTVSPADKIYSTLRTSAGSRFGRQWLGFLISFPRSEYDFMMRNYDLAQKVDSHGHRLFPYIFTDKGCTWEINLGVARADLEEDYLTDPEDARLKYECLPPPVRGGFFSLPEKIDSAFYAQIPPAIRWSPKHTESFDGQEFVGVQVDGMYLPKNVYVAHFDPGLSADAFTLVLAHPNWNVHDEVKESDEEGESKSYLIPQVVIDAVMMWRPDKQLRRSVDFLNASEVILRIAKHAHLARAAADRWNSEHIRQSLLAAKIPCNFDGYTRRQQVDHYKNLKAVMYRGLLRIRGSYDGRDYPAHARLREELRRLVLVNGVRVDHPDGGSKDLADALAGAVWLACQASLGQQAFRNFTMDNNDSTMVNSHNILFQNQWTQRTAPTAADLLRRGLI